MVKRIFLYLVTIGCVYCTSRFAFADSSTGLPIADDKLSHVCVSATGVATLETVWKTFDEEHRVNWMNRGISSSAILGFGIYKEMMDMKRKKQNFDWEDLSADVLGIVTGNLIHWEF